MELCISCVIGALSGVSRHLLMPPQEKYDLQTGPHCHTYSSPRYMSSRRDDDLLKKRIFAGNIIQEVLTIKGENFVLLK